MFTFTKFVVVDSVDRTTGMLLVSFSNKYALYNASRRRVMTDVMRADSGVDPVSLINNAQFDIWFHGSDYRRSSLHAIETLSYADALLYANDRYDINQMMRGVLRPACASDGRIHPVDRRLINQRV